ncbi:MAG: S1 RNA-binding domain-containing protein [Planctomycetes bacterium]|nr:S1 RNA-binding domain-containing protein [Planctomycetota bacterium]
MSNKPRNLDDDARDQANISDAELDALLAGSLGGAAAGREATELEPGEEVEGVVIGADEESVILEFGKNSGAIPLSEFHGPAPEPGTRVKATYRRFDAARGMASLSVSEVLRDLFWREARVGMIVEGRVIDVNKGGLVLLVKNERAFMPISQIDIDHVEDPAEFRDQILECEITAIDHDRAELVVSRKKLLREREAERRQSAIHSFEIGQRVDGIVRRVNEHGAFIDVGGMDGLLHSSKLRRSRDVLGDGPSVGDTLRVEIIHIDPEQGRIGLDLVREFDPGASSTAASNAPAIELVVGESVTGMVSRVRDEGAYLFLDDGVEGFIPVAELRADPLRSGNVVTAEVVSYDAGRRSAVLRRKPS